MAPSTATDDTADGTYPVPLSPSLRSRRTSSPPASLFVENTPNADAFYTAVLLADHSYRTNQDALRRIFDSEQWLDELIVPAEYESARDNVRMGLAYATECLVYELRRREVELRRGQGWESDEPAHEDRGKTYEGALEGSEGGSVPPEMRDGAYDLRELEEVV